MDKKVTALVEKIFSAAEDGVKIVENKSSPSAH